MENGARWLCREVVWFVFSQRKTLTSNLLNVARKANQLISFERTWHLSVSDQVSKSKSLSN